MDNLSLTINRLIKRFFIYSIIFAILTLVIPSIVISFHSDPKPGPKPMKTVASSTIKPMESLKQSQMPQSLNLSNGITFGWVTGQDSQLNQFNNLKVVSPLLATIGGTNDINYSPSLSDFNNIKKNGKKIWGRVAMNNQTSAETHQFLNDSKQTSTVIQGLVKAAHDQQLDGINMDIENINPGDRSAFTTFIISLSKQLKKDNVTLSVDIQPDQSNSQQDLANFHRLLGQYCDYVIFMGYDQHWASDSQPGPVTSLQWLNTNISQFIKTGIPPQKLLLALPSYTRIWEVNQNGQAITSRALSNTYVDSLIKKDHLTTKWDPNLATYYTSYTQQGKKYEIWLTNKQSLKTYLTLVNKYHLAGYGFWQLNTMTPSDWNQIAEAI